MNMILCGSVDRYREACCLLLQDRRVNMKMKEAGSSKMLVGTYQASCCRISVH